MTSSITTTAVFRRPFELPGLDEILPAGEYEIEVGPVEPADRVDPGPWPSSVLLRLHARTTHPGLGRTLIVSVAALSVAFARDRLTDPALCDLFLEEMLADPMIRLVMQADGVAESDLRDLYAAWSNERSVLHGNGQHVAATRDGADTLVAGSRTGPVSTGTGA